MKLSPLKTINLAKHQTLNEKWLQDVIYENPTIIGLGEVIARDYERIQKRAGRLDLLLESSDNQTRYEVEIQLGATDESHIIRTIEYWDLERRRFPKYDHVGVIIAEDVTSRFLNVISLFNGFIPLMAIQVSAIETSDGVGLQFTRILDTFTDFEVEDESEPADRNYWIEKSTKTTVQIADKLIEFTKEFVEEEIELNFNKHYIGTKVNGRSFNFISFRPKKNFTRLEIKLPQTEDNDKLMEDSGLTLLDYDSRWRQYRINLTEKDIVEKKDILIDLMRKAYYK